MNACEQYIIHTQWIYHTLNVQQFRKSNRKPYKNVDKKYNFVKEITKIESIKRTDLK